MKNGKMECFLSDFMYKKGITYTHLAMATGISKTSLQRYGALESYPDVVKATKIAQYFGVLVEDIWK